MTEIIVTCAPVFEGIQENGKQLKCDKCGEPIFASDSILAEVQKYESKGQLLFYCLGCSVKWMEKAKEAGIIPEVPQAKEIKDFINDLQQRKKDWN